MMNFILSYIIILILFLVLDGPMILHINRPMYDTQFNRINNCSNNNISNNRIFISVVIAYFLLALSIYLFIVHPEIGNYKIDYLKLCIKSILLGLIIYGIYNSTNMATIKEWGVKEFIVDTVWGMVLFGITGISSIYLIKHFNL
jgi:uncharacterized membrane protein